MAIGELARRAGVSVRSVCHYESEGLVRPAGRCANGYRIYDQAAVARVQQVKELVSNGVPLRLVKELLPHLEPGSLVPSSPCRHFIEQLVVQRSKLDGRISQLTRDREALNSYLDVVRSAASVVDNDASVRCSRYSDDR